MYKTRSGRTVTKKGLNLFYKLLRMGYFKTVEDTDEIKAALSLLIRHSKSYNFSSEQVCSNPYTYQYYEKRQDQIIKRMSEIAKELAPYFEDMRLEFTMYAALYSGTRYITDFLADEW